MNNPNEISRKSLGGLMMLEKVNENFEDLMKAFER